MVTQSVVTNGAADMTKLRSFSYSSLQDATQEIRLIRILPIDSIDLDVGCTGVIPIEMIHVYRNAAPQYDAVSYTWGNAGKVKEVLVINYGQGSRCQYVKVTESLYHALLELQSWRPNTNKEGDGEHYHRNDYIWIDALCIDQSNIAEKSQQVLIMKDIFGQAAQVVIHLGSGVGLEYQLAMKTITEIMTPYLCWKASKDQRSADEKLQYNEVLVSLKDFMAKGGDIGGRLFHAIRQFFKAPWWNRVWVIQEVAAAKHAWILSGGESLEFSYLQRFYSATFVLHEIPETDVAVNWSHSILMLRSFVIKVVKVLTPWFDIKLPLFHAMLVIFINGGSQATDPRDVLYALKGLDLEVNALMEKTDYSLAWEHLYTLAAHKFISEHGLFVLSFCASSAERFHSGLPSWVPDWSKYMAPTLDTSPPRLFSACGKTAAQIIETDSFNELKVKGVYVTRIEQVREPSLLSGYRYDNTSAEFGRKALKPWFQDMFRLAGLCHSERSEQAKMAARTASADMIRCNGQEDIRLPYDDTNVILAMQRVINMIINATSPDLLQDSSTVRTLAISYLQTCTKAAEFRRPFKSEAGHLGLAPEVSDVGDIICIFHGARVPFALRPVSGGRYRLLGEAYVSGIMDGEFMAGDNTIKEFVLC